MKGLLSKSKKNPSLGAATASDCGLSSDGLRCNGIALGFFPEYGKTNARALNRNLPQPMSIIGDYVQISNKDSAMRQIDWHLEDVLACLPAVWAIALMPEGPLRDFNAERAESVARKLADVNRHGVTVWLRFAHEMNGDWYSWGRKAKEFIATWRLLTEAVRLHTRDLKTRTWMLWSPNVAGSSAGPEGYAQYWPGTDYVDICGLSIYVYGDRNDPVPPQSFAKPFQDFYKLYALGEGKQITLAETSAPYRYDQGTGQPLPGQASEISVKLEWLQQITSQTTAEKFPLLKSVVWFNYDKIEDGMRKDFRALHGTAEVSAAMEQAIRSMSM